MCFSSRSIVNHGKSHRVELRSTFLRLCLHEQIIPEMAIDYLQGVCPMFGLISGKNKAVVACVLFCLVSGYILWAPPCSATQSKILFCRITTFLLG